MGNATDASHASRVSAPLKLKVPNVIRDTVASRMMPASTFVHLVRHGEVNNPDHVVYADIEGFGLSERGRRQVEDASEYLSDHSISAIYASPLQRATETAVALARPHGLSVTAIPDLTEWFLAQQWKGLTWDSLPVERPGELEAYLEHPLDMAFSPESLEALAVRMVTVVESIASEHVGEEVVVVSHQDPVQAARLALTHRTLGSLNTDKPGHAEVFTLEMAAPWVEVQRFLPGVQETFPPT